MKRYSLVSCENMPKNSTAQIYCLHGRISIFWTVSVFKNTNWGNGLRILVALMAQNIQSGPAAVSVYGECIQTPRFARLTFTESACGADSPPHLSSTPRLHAPLFMNENINSPSAEVSPRKKNTLAYRIITNLSEWFPCRIVVLFILRTLRIDNSRLICGYISVEKGE